MNRERGKLTYAKNGDLGVVRLPEVEKFYWRGYPMDLKTLRDIQKEHNYTDKNLILNGRDFSKSFEVMRAEIEARIGIKPIKEFGTNYAEHYHSGESAIAKLLNEKQGQVAGAFWCKELGDIDLVWGEVTGSGKEAKGWGLAKIIEKHLNAGDFKAFGEGETGLINAISEIIQDGKVVTQNGVDSIVLRKNGQEYRVGISKGWDNVGENKWIITSYKNNKYKESAETSYHDTFTSKEPLENPVSTIIPQSLDTLPPPAQNLIKKLLYQIHSLEKSPSFREHDKIIAEIKKSNDTTMLATLLKIFDERYPSAKDHYLLSGLRESIQNTLNKLSNPHIAKVLQAFTEKHPNPRNQAQAVKELYHRYGEESLKELFDKVLSAAGDVKFSIRQTYANANGKYFADKHLITLNRRWALDIEPQRLAQTLLHELIHATIARAQYHRFSPQAYPELAHKLTPAQKAAVQEIDDLYILAFKTHQAQKRAKTLADDEQEFYGFTNSKEFVAELANPKFRSYLEKQNIFKRVLEAIVKFFTGGEGEQTNILKALQESYEKYLDNFGESSESFFGKKEGGASPSESRTLFDKADSSESFSYTTGKAKGIAELRKDLKQALEPSLNKEIVNKEQGLSGVITTDEVKKIMSKKAVDKSIVNGFTRDEHIEVAKHIEKLFTESKLLRSHKDYKENPNILQVHRFVKDIEVNGKEANALITLFEKMQGKNKIYTIELESLESTPLSTQAKSAGAAVKAQSAAATPTEAAPIAKTDGESIAHK